MKNKMGIVKTKSYNVLNTSDFQSVVLAPAGSIRITCKLVRNTNSQVQLQTFGARYCVSTSHPGDSDAC